MNKYEAMFIVKPDLSEEEKKSLFAVISEAISKNNGSVTNAAVWSEKRKMTFTLKRQQEGIYYLVNFDLDAGAEALSKIKYAFKLNESILRVMILRVA
jgi:small subunit ribosomal protein S6